MKRYCVDKSIRWTEKALIELAIKHEKQFALNSRAVFCETHRIVYNDSCTNCVYNYSPWCCTVFMEKLK